MGMGTGRALGLPCCFGRGMSLVLIQLLGCFRFFLVVSAAPCPPLALCSLPGVFGSDYTYKEDGDGVYSQGFYPSTNCCGRRPCY